jgi:Rha family phage regulatory protein
MDTQWLWQTERDRRLGDQVAPDRAFVEMRGGGPMASSLVLALSLGRPHDVLLRDIANVGASADFCARNFVADTYSVPDQRGRQAPMLWLTRDAMAVILGASCIGYVGPGIEDLRRAYLDAFDKEATDAAA